MSNNIQYKSSTHRIHSLDLLRGFAVLGILIMNITSFSHVNIAYMNPTIGAGIEGYNQYFHAFNYIFADTRFMSIFSILFGAGVVLFANNAEANVGRTQSKTTGINAGTNVGNAGGGESRPRNVAMMYIIKF